MRILKQAIKDLVSSVTVKSGLVSTRRRGGNERIFIFMYHRVNPERDFMGLSISPLFFDQQLAFLTSRFKLITLAESVSMLSNGIPSGEYAVITFDDGYRDNYDYAFSILKKHKVPATIFVTVEGLQTGDFEWCMFDRTIFNSEREILDLTKFNLGMINIRTRAKKEQALFRLHHELKQCAHEIRDAVVKHVVNELSGVTSRERIMLSWEEAKEMQESGLVTIGSHTLTHPILTQTGRERARDEIVRSKEIIEGKLGTVVDLFAYPNGRTEDFDDDIVEMLKHAGYAAACSTVSGSAKGGDSMYRLPRVDVTFGMCEGIGGRFSPEMFEMAMSK